MHKIRRQGVQDELKSGNYAESEKQNVGAFKICLGEEKKINERQLPARLCTETEAF